MAPRGKGGPARGSGCSGGADGGGDGGRAGWAGRAGG
ncbi:RNA-binding protein, partial [Subtercola vilae]